MTNWDDLDIFTSCINKGSYFIRIEKSGFFISKKLSEKLKEHKCFKLAYSKINNAICFIFQENPTPETIRIINPNGANRHFIYAASFLNHFKIDIEKIKNKRFNTFFEQISGYDNCLVIYLNERGD